MSSMLVMVLYLSYVSRLSFIEMNFGKTNIAKQQSFHFFDNISHREWKLLSKRVQKVRREQSKAYKKRHRFQKVSRTKHFYQHNYQPDFTCPNEERVGCTKGHGGKWLCNPRNIKAASQDRVRNGGNGCMIYTSSTKLNQFQFEKSLLDMMDGTDCEVHVFYPNTGKDAKDFPQEVREIPSEYNIIYHPWGFKSSADTRVTPNLRSLHATAKILHHEGKTIDLLALDCDGCEFDIFHDLLDSFRSNPTNTINMDADNVDNELSPIFMQMLIQVHGVPDLDIIHRFFQSIQDEGYVTFHKSMGAADSENGGIGGKNDIHDYGFLRLTKDFFSERD